MENKSGIITGGTDGIGLACAEILVHNSFNVFVFGKTEFKLNNALQKLGKKARGMTADVSKVEDLEKVFDTFDKQFGKLDFIINNAAIAARSILANDPEQIKQFIDINLNGYLIATQMALLRMIPNNYGHIINIGSLSAKTRDRDTDLYVSSKSAIEGFSDSIRKKINPLGIKLTLIEPGGTATGMVSESPAEKIFKQEKCLMLRPEDVAEAVLFALTQPKRVEIMEISIKAECQII